MDELIAAIGLGKATVYRLFPSKDALIGAYLRRLAQTILAAIDADIARHRDDPRPPFTPSSPPSAGTWPAPATAAAPSTTPASSSPTPTIPPAGPPATTELNCTGA